MGTKESVLKPSAECLGMATYLASVVRNAMEDFHVRHLPDAQMRELNPVIRNAIYTGLEALAYSEKSPAARAFVDYQKALIPTYWEEPELLPGFAKTVLMLEDAAGGDGEAPKELGGSDDASSAHHDPRG